MSFVNVNRRIVNVNAQKYLPGIYLLKVNNRNTRTRCEVFSKLTIKTTERRQCQWRRSGVFIVNFEHISPYFSVSIINFEHEIAGWVILGICMLEKGVSKQGYTLICILLLFFYQHFYF